MAPRALPGPQLRPLSLLGIHRHQPVDRLVHREQFLVVHQGQNFEFIELRPRQTTPVAHGELPPGGGDEADDTLTPAPNPSFCLARPPRIADNLGPCPT